MITQVIKADKESIIKAAQIIVAWDIVAFPTETIYGLFADATNPEAIKKIFIAKNRPSDNPLIVHFAYASDISHYAIIENPIQQLLIDKLMPGPLTLVLPKKDIIPSITTGNLETLCVRIPDHVLSKQLIRHSGVPLAWPSANLSWRPSPISSDMVMKDMDGRITLIIDWWKTLYGIESTVVKVSQQDNRYIVSILRPWFITKEDIENLVWDEAIVLYNDKGINESPWTRYRHYSPQSHIKIIDTIDDIDFKNIYSPGKKYALIATTEFLSDNISFIDTLHQDYSLITMPLGSLHNMIECIQSLYQLYSTCDELSIDTIFIQSLPEEGVWYALMNRIRKSVS